MAPKSALAVVLVAVMMCGTLANDVPVKFCAKDCSGNPLSGYQVQLSGCTDRPATCTTHESDGCCTIDRSPDVIQYCYGSATYLCQWSILSGYNNNLMASANNNDRHLLVTSVANDLPVPSNIEPFIPDFATLMKDGKQVTPRQFSGCMCDGKNYCKPVIYSIPEDQDCTDPFTVTFKPKSCGCSLEGPVYTDAVIASGANHPLRKLK